MPTIVTLAGGGLVTSTARRGGCRGKHGVRGSLPPPTTRAVTRKNARVVVTRAIGDDDETVGNDDEDKEENAAQTPVASTATPVTTSGDDDDATTGRESASDADVVGGEPKQPSIRFPLADPVSLRALRGDGSEATSGLKYAQNKDGTWDLTVGAAENARGSGNNGPMSLADLARSALPEELRGLLPTSGYFGTATFETPQVAFAYERGWRDSFKRAGFPGPDEEFQLATDALGETAQGGIIVDASCGSGLFTRRFLKTKKYAGVVALDYSDAMLRQAKQYMEDENLLGERNVCFVRADIARLPFPEGTIDGVHAGAAIHCWPDATTGVAEISRVLKPGATFCGTTFMNPQVPFFDEDQQAVFDSVVREFSGTKNAARGFRWWSKKELKDLCTECGLVDFKCEIRNQFIFFSAKKGTPTDEVTPVQVA